MEAASSASSKKTHIALCSPHRGAGPRSYMPSLRNFSRDRSSYADADRFIPNQSAMDFDFANYMITQSRKDKENAAGASTSKEAYQNILDEVLLNNRTRILAFNSKPHLPPERVPSSHQTKSARRQRHIPQSAERTLDAPELIDDYYLYLLDWGCNLISKSLVITKRLLFKAFPCQKTQNQFAPMNWMIFKIKMRVLCSEAALSRVKY